MSATATVATPVETKSCPRCDGSGELGTTRRDPASGAWDTESCWFCDGTGTVSEEALMCTVCYQPLEPEDACQHGVDVLCRRDCAYRCFECADEDLERRAELWLEDLR